ncbi:MAG: polysaccharide deacetylase [Firmicutes bacterium]|nr:polysaccharide deacetylase [Bacillota bacterium]
MPLFKQKSVLWILTIFISLLVGLSYMSTSLLSGIPVLNYHQINNKAHNALTLSSQEFDAQMAYLHESGYNSISPDQLVDYLQYGKTLPPNPILITFDDGYEDNYRVAYPILQKYNFTATIFLITDFISNSNRYLTWSQVKEMQENGFSFGSHTLSHLFLTNASDNDILFQLTKSREAMEWRLNQKIEYLAYPGGAYDQQVIKLARQVGYRAAFTIDLGRNTAKCGLFTLNRIPIFAGTHSFLRFQLRLKFTQIIIAVQSFKDKLNILGATTIANWISTP